MPAVGWGLLDAMDDHEVSFEDVGAVEGFLHLGTGAGAEAAHHGAFVVRERVALAVVFACKPLL